MEIKEAVSKEMTDIVAVEIMVYVYCVMMGHVKLMILLIGLAQIQI